MFEGFELPMGNERKGNAKESCVNQINYNNMKLSETIIKLYANYKANFNHAHKTVHKSHFPEFCE